MIFQEFLYDCAYKKSAENPILSDTRQMVACKCQ